MLSVTCKLLMLSVVMLSVVAPNVRLGRNVTTLAYGYSVKVIYIMFAAIFSRLKFPTTKISKLRYFHIDVTFSNENSSLWNSFIN